AGDDAAALGEPLYRSWLREKVGASDGDGGKGHCDGNGNGGISRPYADPLLRDEAPPDVEEGEALRVPEADGQVLAPVRLRDELGGGAGDGDDDDDDPGRLRDECLAFASDQSAELRHCHLLLIRDPVSVLGSWMGKSGDVHGDNPHPDEVGIAQLLDVCSKVLGASMDQGEGCGDEGEGDDAAVVVDSDDLATYPEATLRGLCAALGIGRDSMLRWSARPLRWSARPHECDGPWVECESVNTTLSAIVADDHYLAHPDEYSSPSYSQVVVPRRLGEHQMERRWRGRGGGSGATRRYRTVPPALLPALRMSVPAYNFLCTLTLAHRTRPCRSLRPGGCTRIRGTSLCSYTTPSAPGRRGAGQIVPRDIMGILPFDSSVQGGDATW
ncbi:LOW QUALITY PROTEIN: hypothetical protein ACHAWF_018101, partial [Thalassiosira exigua]